MPYEDPGALLARLKLGREEFAQRLLTTLILGGTYPRWNTRSTPTAHGLQFLNALSQLSFDGPDWVAPVTFIDEFELPGRTHAERGGAPDWAVLTADRLWLIELKTEAASHRPNQIRGYFDLAAHHHPHLAVDITYLTPPMPGHLPHLTGGQRFAHLTWDAVAPVITATWGETEDTAIKNIVDAVLACLDDLKEPARHWRERRLGLRPLSAPHPPSGDAPTSRAGQTPLATALHLAAATATDGRQRALDHKADSLEELQQLRLELRQAITGSAIDEPIGDVMPWLWRHQSGGRPLTAAGAELGYELRFSRSRGNAAGRRGHETSAP